MQKNILIYMALFYAHTLHTFEKTTFTFSNDPIDVVIPCHRKDASTLDRLIASVQSCVIGVRRVIVVSSEQFTDKAEWFDESLFPFSKKSIMQEICVNPVITEREMQNTRTTGWIYQQFLKLYAPIIIPNISSNVLIVDADLLFLKPTSFLQENGAGLYATGTEYHRPYFEHAKRLLPDLVKLYSNHSGIAHHMLYQREILLDFFDHIRTYHNIEPWIAIARAIKLNDKGHIVHSCLSEYEMYFNFAFARTDQVKIRPLKWTNISNASQIQRYKTMKYHYVALHIYNE